ncbi:MAG: lamin tail domain-containing protein [Rhizobiales bacterium]|nr:lamin tail domain-containing protein [Hyphomicrobiales bacterium]
MMALATIGRCPSLRYMLHGVRRGTAPAICKEASVTMAGLSIGERAKLSMLLGRRTLRSVAGRLRGHPVVRLSFIPRKAERLLIAPQDLRTADGTRASEIYAGRLSFPGKVVINELMTTGPQGANDEFVELYNPNSCAISLAGWRLAYKPKAGSGGPPADLGSVYYTFAAGDSIAAGAFFVWAQRLGPSPQP